MREKFKMTFKEFVQFMASDEVKENITSIELIAFRMNFEVFKYIASDEVRERVWQERYKEKTMQDLVIPIKKRLEVKANG